MIDWSEKKLKRLKKLVKKGKTPKKIAQEFEKKRKKGYKKNVFQIISQIRSLPELRQYFQHTELTINDLEKFAEEFKKDKKPLKL
ncbi:MAG: hypothetical protein ACTSQQ_13665 [Candidatus Helarchaeota archaeon]